MRYTDPEGDHSYGIHEVYYRDDEATIVSGWTKNAVGLLVDHPTPEGLEDVLSMVRRAADMPILEYTDGVPLNTEEIMEAPKPG